MISYGFKKILKMPFETAKEKNCEGAEKRGFWDSNGD